MASPRIYLIQPPAEISPGDQQPIVVDVIELCRRSWEREEDYAEDDTVRPTSSVGYAAEVEVAGTTGAFEPKWPKEADKRCKDGSVTWKMIPAGTNGLDAAGDPTAEVSPAGGLEVSELAVNEFRKLVAVYSSPIVGRFTVLFGFKINGRQRYARHEVIVQYQ